MSDLSAMTNPEVSAAECPKEGCSARITALEEALRDCIAQLVYVSHAVMWPSTEITLIAARAALKEPK